MQKGNTQKKQRMKYSLLNWKESCLFRLFRNSQILIPLLFILCFASFFVPHFMVKDNILNILRQISVLSLISIGSTLVIITGGIDLSVGSVMALVAVYTATAVKAGTSFWIIFPVAILFGMLIGMVNGILIMNFTIPPFIVTLAVMTIGRGLVLLRTGGSNITELGNKAFLFLGRGFLLGIPFPIIILFVFYLFWSIVLNNTRFAREVYAIGNNEEASKVAGIAVRRVILYVYMIAGMMASVGAVIDTSRMNTVTAMYGNGIEFDCVTAVVLGGASLDGGSGRVMNTLYGAALLGIINNLFNLLGVSTYWGQIVKGLILILAVMTNTTLKRRD
ncbi:MAG: ABC transporter permease [Sphaerochaetaceae bacterium]